MQIVVLGLSHRTAPVALRERLAVIPSDVETQLKELVAVPGIREATLISTCNRVEIYASAVDLGGALGALRQHLRHRIAGAEAEAELDRHLYERAGREAVHHLFRVTASLDSLVIGEPQILGQVKDAYEAAVRAGTVGPVINFAFQRAFRTARRVRRDTGIARQTTSISSVAVELARQVWSGFEGRTVLLIGAGKMADLAARALRASGARVVVTNRTAARADELAARLSCETAPWSDLAGALAAADIVITSTGAREPILGSALLADVQRRRRRRPLVLIDIAVPRDVDASVADLPGIYLWDIDDLQKVAAEHLEGRRGEADRAEALVEQELDRSLSAHRGRGVGPTITALRTKFLGVARAEAEKTLATLGTTDERTRRAVQAMSEAIAAKLLHAPQVAIKKAAATDEGDALLAAAYPLFDLPAVEAMEEPEDDVADEAAAGGAASKVSGS